MQVFGHSGDTYFTVVVVTNILCCPSLDHLYFEERVDPYTCTHTLSL